MSLLGTIGSFLLLQISGPLQHQEHPQAEWKLLHSQDGESRMADTTAAELTLFVLRALASDVGFLDTDLHVTVDGHPLQFGQQLIGAFTSRKDPIFCRVQISDRMMNVSCGELPPDQMWLYSFRLNQLQQGKGLIGGVAARSLDHATEGVHMAGPGGERFALSVGSLVEWYSKFYFDPSIDLAITDTLSEVVDGSGTPCTITFYRSASRHF